MSSFLKSPQQKQLGKGVSKCFFFGVRNCYKEKFGLYRTVLLKMASLNMLIGILCQDEIRYIYHVRGKLFFLSVRCYLDVPNLGQSMVFISFKEFMSIVKGAKSIQGE